MLTALSSHNHTALIFADQAFAVPELTSAEEFFRLRIPPGQHQLELSIKEEMQ
jgi:hypothetical protein